jgi:hypothetical protein
MAITSPAQQFAILTQIGRQENDMSKITQTTQASFTRLVTRFADGADVDRRDTLRRTEWRPSRWPDSNVSTPGR